MDRRAATPTRTSLPIAAELQNAVLLVTIDNQAGASEAELTAHYVHAGAAAETSEVHRKRDGYTTGKTTPVYDPYGRLCGAPDHPRLPTGELTTSIAKRRSAF